MRFAEITKQLISKQATEGKFIDLTWLRACDAHSFSLAMQVSRPRYPKCTQTCGDAEGAEGRQAGRLTKEG